MPQSLAICLMNRQVCLEGRVDTVAVPYLIRYNYLRSSKEECFKDTVFGIFKNFILFIIIHRSAELSYTSVSWDVEIDELICEWQPT